MINDSISAAVIADCRPFQPESDIASSARLDFQNTLPWDAWLRICAERSDDIIMVTADPMTLLTCDRLIVSDHFDPPTLLSGIHAALFTANHDFLFVTYAAIPIVSPAMIDLLLQTIETRFDAVVFESPDGLQPLPAAFSKRGLKPLARQLSNRDHNIRRFLRQLRIQTIGANACRNCDPAWRPFFHNKVLPVK